VPGGGGKRNAKRLAAKPTYPHAGGLRMEKNPGVDFVKKIWKRKKKCLPLRKANLYTSHDGLNVRTDRSNLAIEVATSQIFAVSSDGTGKGKLTPFQEEGKKNTSGASILRAAAY